MQFYYNYVILIIGDNMKKKGFTLIELIVSIVLVSIILVSLVTTLVKVRQTYDVIYENSDVLVYSSLVSRVINNDINENAGINYINCNVEGTKCDIYLGNNEVRQLLLDEKSKTEVEGNITHENIKTTIKYVNTTKGKKELKYIKTLELNRYINSETGKVTAEGYNFLRIKLKTKEYVNPEVNERVKDTVDVITNLEIKIWDGISEENSSDYNIEIYSSNRYDISGIKGRIYIIGLDAKEADVMGTTSIEEEYGVGFYKVNSEHTKENEIEKIEVPLRYGYYFKGYKLKEEEGKEKLVIDETGKIVVTNREFKRNINISEDYPRVEAIWEEIGNIRVVFDYQGGSGSDLQKEVTYNKEYGILPSAKKDGYTFEGWYTKASGGTKIEEDTIVKKRENHTLYAHYNVCPANHYSNTNANICEECPSGMTSAQGSTAKTACKITCPDGKYLPKNTSVCATCPAGNKCTSTTCYFSKTADCGKTTCPAGTYQADTGKSTCSNCPAGKYSGSAGSTSCTDCAAGYCQPDTGKTSCIKCVEDKKWYKTCRTGQVIIHKSGTLDSGTKDYSMYNQSGYTDTTFTLESGPTLPSGYVNYETNYMYYVHYKNGKLSSDGYGYISKSCITGVGDCSKCSG